MEDFKITMLGTRLKEKRLLRAELTVTVRAETRDDAVDVITDSLPGFDWQWTAITGLAPIVPTPQSIRS